MGLCQARALPSCVRVAMGFQEEGMPQDATQAEGSGWQREGLEKASENHGRSTFLSKNWWFFTTNWGVMNIKPAIPWEDIGKHLIWHLGLCFKTGWIPMNYAIPGRRLFIIKFLEYPPFKKPHLVIGPFKYPKWILISDIPHTSTFGLTYLQLGYLNFSLILGVRISWCWRVWRGGIPVGDFLIAGSCRY